MNKIISNLIKIFLIIFVALPMTLIALGELFSGKFKTFFIILTAFFIILIIYKTATSKNSKKQELLGNEEIKQFPENQTIESELVGRLYYLYSDYGQKKIKIPLGINAPKEIIFIRKKYTGEYIESLVLLSYQLCELAESEVFKNNFDKAVPLYYESVLLLDAHNAELKFTHYTACPKSKALEKLSQLFADNEDLKGIESLYNIVSYYNKIGNNRQIIESAVEEIKIVSSVYDYIEGKNEVSNNEIKKALGLDGRKLKGIIKRLHRISKIEATQKADDIIITPLSRNPLKYFYGESVIFNSRHPIPRNPHIHF